jgi:hypothetical protein
MAQGQTGSKDRDGKPELRWSQVARVANATGHRGFPQLHPEVTVPVSRLPFDQVERHSVQMLYLSWIECGMRCPVEKYRGERNEAREERDALSRDLATLREEHSRALADLTAVRATVDQLNKTAASDRAELNQLRQSATYQLPQGTVKLQQQASRSEVLWNSTGSLEAAP